MQRGVIWLTSSQILNASMYFGAWRGSINVIGSQQQRTDFLDTRCRSDLSFADPNPAPLFCRLLNHILTEAHGYRCAVILNEFGESAGIEKALLNDSKVRISVTLDVMDHLRSNVYILEHFSALFRALHATCKQSLTQMQVMADHKGRAFMIGPALQATPFACLLSIILRVI